ncbi:RNA polymerase sigma factor [Chitinophaga sp. Cy-1792]|uniref:RNA polymerase sigma factor n=1 Tax=Chitinophaga sp. Cy-1792 TaxID=2608339 RepID=UPI0014243DC3|nr:sigma-70 family RNA polymerase sigma factor [Chitinophaga sp. Cy-1792]NIG54376.1 sigma-70 family RNA polymerase sigma factor [Chitinophaga sp. Cy-1792]
MEIPAAGELWEGLLQGDEARFFELFDTWYPGLLAYGLRITQDRELVKDTINQTFFYFWEKRAILITVEHPAAYTYTSFRRRLISAAAKTNALLQFPGDLVNEGLDQVEASHEHLLISQIRLRELEEILSRAIGRLSARKQELIRMKYYEGLSYSEIADKTKLTERTIYNKIHEAIKTLRANLTADGHSKEIISAIHLLLL